MISFKKIFISILFVLTISVIFPQIKPGRFESINMSDGLSHNSGLCLLQDHQGYLWIGTQNGLCRYDGYSVKKFLHKPDDRTSISGNYINSIFQDKAGVIWVGTNKGGINKFNATDESFRSYQNDSNDLSSIGNGSIYSISEDHFGNLWIAVNPSGLYLFDKQEEKFFHISESSGLEGTRTFCLYKDSGEDLWVGTDKGLNKLSIVKRNHKEKSISVNSSSILNEFKISFRNWKNDPQNGNSLVNDVVNCIEEDNRNGNKVLWIGTEAGLSEMKFTAGGNASFINYKHNPQNQKSISSNMVWSVLKDSKGRLWIGTRNGINLFNYGSNTFNQKIYSPSKANSETYTVRFILEDYSGVIWFGTEDFAVFKLLNENKNFLTFSNEPLNKNSISGNNITAVYEDKEGNLWVGTKYAGLNKLDSTEREYGKFIHFINDPFNNQSLLHNHVSSVFEDSEGTIWVGSWNSVGGLNQLIHGGNSFIHSQHDPSDPFSLSDNQVKNIVEDNEGNLWIALSETGIDLFDKKNKSFTHFSHSPDDPSSISDNSVINIFPDDDYLWISTFNGGLNKLNLKTKKFTHYKFDPKNNYCISSNRVWSVYKDNLGRYWVGTDNGINYFNPATERFVSFDESDGLINNSVYGILEDSNGNLWLSTQNGITKMEISQFSNGLPESVHFTNYDSEDHWAISEFNSNAFLKSKTGELFFGGVDGLIHFYPDSIKSNTTIPAVVLTSFKIFEKEAKLDTSITLKRNIETAYSENFFSFEFAALDFQSPDRNEYAYKLEGFNDNWIYIGNRRFVSFSHLDPGKYVFKVKAANNDGIWNEAGTSVEIVITPPFWLTIWFRLLSLFIILTILTYTLRYFFTRKYKKRIREFAVQQKIQDERERISRELHDSIGANLTSIITGLEISKRFSQVDDKKNLIENINSLENHTRSTIDELRQTIWSLNTKVNGVEQLNEKIKEYILHIANFDEKMKIKFDFDGDGGVILSSTQALNLFRIVQESIHNAIKYAYSSAIQVNVKSQNHLLRILIMDDGNGFDMDEIKLNPTGYGIANIKKRAAEIKAKLEIDTVLKEGTTIKVELEIKDNPNRVYAES